jgi:hypothetical protein
VDNIVENSLQAVIVLGVIVKDLGGSIHVSIDHNETTVAIGGGGSVEDTEGEESKSSESERTHCRWLKIVGKRE